MTGSGIIDNPWDIVTALASVGNIGARCVLNLRSGTYAGDFSSEFVGMAGYPATIKNYIGETVLIDGSLDVTGEYALVEGLTITDLDFTDRTTDTPPSPTGAQALASNIEFRDCIVHDCAGGFYHPNTVQDIIYDGCIIFYNGYIGTDRPHSHGIYAKYKCIIRNCIIFSNMQYGVHIYGSGTNLDDCSVLNTIAFCNTDISGGATYKSNMLHGNESGTVVNPTWRNNCTYRKASVDGYQNKFGYDGGVQGAVITDNYMPEGCQLQPGTYTENSGNTLAAEEVNRIFVFNVRGRAHVAVYNWELLETVTIDLSSMTNMSAGDTVSVTNVQDLAVDIANKTLDGSKCITVDMRAASHSVSTPQGLSAPASTFPEFGCFVVRKV